MLPIILAGSVGMSSLFFSWGILTLVGMPVIPLDFIGWMDYIVFAVLAGIGPIGFYNHLKDKRRKEVEDHLPDFLRDIANSSASGMTIYDSIRSASQGDYGALTPELKMMAAQLSWSIPVDEALTNFAKRINTDEVKRLAITINKALEIGGNTTSVFNAAAREIDQIKRVEQQRRAEMSMYSIVIFISFFVFLAVILILNSTIFAALYELEPHMGSIGGMQIQYVDPQVVKDMLFTFVIVQSVGGGLLGGFMMEGRLSSGVKQAFILILISYILFKLLF
jgi:flagellar protein FlaJ